MQVTELVKMAEFLRDFLMERNLPNLYEELINAINEVAQSNNPENVAQKREALLEVHREAAKASLSPAQDKLMADYGANALLGLSAVQRIEDLFQQHQAHPQGLVNSLNELKAETDQLRERANQLVDVLQPMLDSKAIEEAELGENEGRLWLYFSEAASVNTIEQLEDASEIWKQVLHNFSRLPNANAGSGRLLQIQKHSPLEVELAASLALLTPLAFAITWVLSRVEQVIKIQQEAERLKQLKVKTEIVQSVLDNAEEQRAAIVDEAAEQIRDKYNTDGEVRNAVRQALAKVLEFIEQGGKLDIDAESDDADEADEDNPQRDLKGFIEHIREEIRLLPEPPGRDGDEDD